MPVKSLLFRLLIFFLAPCLLFLPACEDAGKPPAPKKKSAEQISPRTAQGIYRIPLRSNPATLDPAQVQSWYGESLVQQLYDGLVRFDRYLSVMPALARTWKVEDHGRVYRFFLHPHAIFHDKTPVTVDDVVFSLSRLLRVKDAPVILPHLLKIEGTLDYRNHRKETVTGIEPVDDHTLVIRLTEPHVPFLTALGMCYAKIIPRRAATRTDRVFAKNPVGSGPFRFVSWDDDTMIRLERFPQYYGDTALVDELHYKIYPGGQDQKILSDFQSGRLDEMPVFGQVRQTLSSKSDLQWFHRSSLSLFFYGMNTHHPHLKSRDLRRALTLALDRQTIVHRIYNDQYETAQTILPPGMPGYAPEKQIEPCNTIQAKNLVEQAAKALGHPVPELEIVSATRSPSSTAELALVQEAWKQVGIQVNIKYITDWADFEAYLKSDALQIYRYAWFADMPEPDNFLYALCGPDSPVNFMRYTADGMLDLFTRARQTMGAVDRAAIYRRIESMILEDFPLIPLFYMSVDRVYQPRVNGIMVSALGAHTMPLNHIRLALPH